MKEIFSTIAILLTLLGYIPYIRSVINGKTIPHIFSWFIWVLAAFTLFGLQLTNGAGVGSFVVLAGALCALTVLLLTIRSKIKQDIVLSDYFFLSIAILSLVLWLFAKQPLLSTILIMFVDISGFVPTVRKAWHKPYSENITFFLINTVRFAFAYLALQEYTFITTIFSVFWFFGNGLFAFMLFARRKLIR